MEGLNVIRVSKVVCSSVLYQRRHTVWKIVRSKAIYNLVENNKFVFVSTILERIPTDIYEMFVDAAQFSCPGDDSSSFYMYWI